MSFPPAECSGPVRERQLPAHHRRSEALLQCQAHQLEALTAEASRLAERWPGLPAAEKRGLLQDLVSRITLKPDCLEIGFRGAYLSAG